MTEWTKKLLTTDVLIIGGGTAGCYAAIRLGERGGIRVLIAEKANITRSGCLAAGVNALNAYISEGHTPEDYVDYAREDAGGIVREDLLLSIARRFNGVTEDLERRGLVILKDADGRYATRGWRNVKINGENIKPILAKGAEAEKTVTVLNHVNITDLLTEGRGKERHAAGAVGFSVREHVFYEIRAKAVLMATGGAAGLYRPNNPGFSRHKMWYPPFNTGAGYAMGLRAGAEMTTLEMRFVALRCKDTIAPTGTIAQGVHARQVNAKGETYENVYGLSTAQRIYGTVEENRKGNGPCYLETAGITKEQEDDLFRAYLNMAPAQTLRWVESGRGPSEQNVEIEGTEPYVVGGHTAGGYWVDTKRETTLRGLFAAGDVAGGAPQKYVTGALAEGEIAAGSIAAYLNEAGTEYEPSVGTRDGAEPVVREVPGNASQKDADCGAPDDPAAQAAAAVAAYRRHLEAPRTTLTWQQAEEAMQKVMDEYAGGIRTDYRYSAGRLAEADRRIARLETLARSLPSADAFDLMHVFEIRERLTVCRALIAHLSARKETRWHTFGEFIDYPEKSGEGLCYINSVMRDGRIRIIRRPLVKGETYEHHD